MAVARLTGVTRRYGDVVAVDNVDLTIHQGEIVGLLGPNGAGKSTVINLLLGLRRPDAGTVEVFGGSPQDPSRRVRLGCTPQETAVPENLRVGEVVSWVAGHFPHPVPTADLLHQFGLDGLERRQTGGLSGGQRRRLSVALALVGRPALVVLDEPTTGLDVTARHELWEALRTAHRAGTTILLTSHYLEEVEALAERVVVMDRGRILADDSLAQVISRVRVRLVSFAGPRPREALPGAVRADHAHGRTQLYVTDSDALVRALVTQQIPFTDLQVRGASLEEAFQALVVTGATDRSPTAELRTTRGQRPEDQLTEGVSA